MRAPPKTVLRTLVGAFTLSMTAFGDTGGPLGMKAEAADFGSAFRYGVCAHVTHEEFDGRARTFEMMRTAGIGTVRCDFRWSVCQSERDGEFDFSRYDAVVDDAAAAGVAVLPILFVPPAWAKPVHKHLPEWGDWVEATVRHFRSRVSAVEIWNEPNLDPDLSNPTNYLAVLSTAYAAAKRAAPSVRVLFGGTSTIPFDYIEEIYRLGGAGSFDVLAVHPYCRWFPPEGLLDTDLEKLRELMGKHGDGAKPVAITEQGWPTHDSAVDGEALRAGLAAARPDKASWNVLYAATAADSDGRPSPDVAAALEDALPPGSRVEMCFGARLRERLAVGDADAVIYPFDETFPIDTADDVFEFVKGGGTLVCLRGMPMWFSVRETAPGSFALDGENRHEALRHRLRIDVSAWWINPDLPESGFAFPTDAAKAAGFRGDPAGESVNRFQTPRLLDPDDEWIPLLTLRDKAGREAVAASAVRFGGDLKGSVVVFGTSGRGLGGTNDERTQARYLSRALAIALAEGVESCFWYEFRSVEESDTYGEHHFGLTHANFAPKPAYGAYMNFILQCPEGSVPTPGPWHDEARSTYFPQWMRPDGTNAGAIWRTGAPERVPCHFDTDAIRFTDCEGKAIHPARLAPGIYAIRLGGAPTFFSGGRLIASPIIQTHNPKNSKGQNP